MILYLWDTASLDAFASFLESDPSVAFEVRRAPMRECLGALRTGEADVALVSALDALKGAAETHLVPRLGLVSYGSFPYVQLHLRAGLDQLKRLAFDPAFAESILLARLIVREHYGQNPDLIPVGQTTAEALTAEVDALLVTGDEGVHSAVTGQYAAASLDLGAEWAELTLRPMVWALFASRNPEFGSDAYTAMLNAAVLFDAAGAALEEMPNDETVTLRILLEEFSLEGLEEFANYLFLTGTFDEMPDLHFAHIPGENDAEDTASSCSLN